MKEATGELNMTVITVVAIAAVAAFFYAFVWPSIQSSITASTVCASAYGCDSNNKCSYDDNGQKKSVDCSKYFKKNGGGNTGGGNTGGGN